MKYPKEIYVYVCDYDDGKPLYAAVVDPELIGEDSSGEKVGIYSLKKTLTFNVKRELK